MHAKLLQSCPTLHDPMDHRFCGGSGNKASACNVGDPGSIPRSGRSPREGNGNPLQYSWLENAMDRGAWWATVHGTAKSWTWLSDFTFTFMDHSPPGSSVHGILQARVLEWLLCPPPGDLPDPGIEPPSLMSPVLAGGFFTTRATWEVPKNVI